jgi:formate/nitrite transporter FocA (FNT family)
MEYNQYKGKEEAMIIKKLLTRKGWRVVAHSMLAAAGIGLLYLLSKMIIADIQQEDTLSWCILGVGIAFSLWLVALGSMLAKAELTDWR